MSILIALKQDGIVYMGGDREVSRDGMMATSCIRVWDSPNSQGLVMGCIAPIDIISPLRNTELLDLSLPDDREFSYDFVRGPFVNRIRYCIRDGVSNDEAYSEDEKESWQVNAQFLIAKNDRLFAIDSTGNTIEIDDFCAVGEGSAAAFDSLMASAADESATSRIQKALSACAESGAKVDLPATVMNTRAPEPRKSFKQILFG